MFQKGNSDSKIFNGNIIPKSCANSMKIGPVKGVDLTRLLGN